MNNFDKELGFEERVRKCVMNDGVYKGWLAKIIEADFPGYKVIGHNEIRYSKDKFDNPTPHGQSQLDGIDVVIYLQNIKNPDIMTHVYIQEKATRKNREITGKYGFKMDFEIVNKNSRRGWACNLNRVHYLIYYYKDCTVVIGGLSKICKICNELYDTWVDDGCRYEDNMSFNCSELKNQKMIVRKGDGGEKRYWSITTSFTEKYVLNDRVYSIRKKKYHYRFD